MIEHSHNKAVTSSIKANFNLKLLWRRLGLRQKILIAFGSLLVMASISTAFTLIKLVAVEKSAFAVIDTQEPMAIKMLSLSQDINHAISLLNTIINSNHAEDKLLYQKVESKLLLFIEDVKNGQHQHMHQAELDRLLLFLDGFVRHAKSIISLSDDSSNNFPVVAIAAEKLEPIANEYLGFINEILARDELDVSEKDRFVIRNMLYDLRYSWLQIMNNFRMSFINQSVKKSSDRLILDGYLEMNGKIIAELQRRKVDIGLGDIDRLSELHKEYSRVLPEIIEMQTSNGWRRDIRIMGVRIKPIAVELRLLLNDQVQDQISSSMNSGAVVSNNLQQIRIYTTMLLAIAIIVGLMVCWVILKAIIPPLVNLMQAADRVSNGDLNSEVFVSSNDEIGQLSRSFNLMVDNLRAAEIERQDNLMSLEKMNQDLEVRVAERTLELEQSETRIRTVHDSVGEGILVIGQNHLIDTINRAALDMFGRQEEKIVGRHASILFADLYDSKSGDCLDTEQFTQLMETHQTKEVIGVRENGEQFPADMLVTKMSLHGGSSLVCIIRDVTKRKEAEQHLVTAQKQVVKAAHKSGMAEMATGVLHNIGNILNSVNISVEEVSRVARNSKISGLIKANSMLADNMENISEFIANDNKGQRLPEYYVKLGKLIEDEFKSISNEVAVLVQKTTMMKEVISTQQSYATAGFLSESFDIRTSIDDALVVQKASLDKWGVKVEVIADELPLISAQKSRVLQVVTNLIKNAKEAMQDNDDYNKERILTITTGIHNSHSVYVCVTDTGCGVSEENLSNIFQLGFTTKDSGHGFGLHASANAMTEMGGALTVRSEGVLKGASFTLIVPVASYAHVGLSSKSENGLSKAV